MSVATVVAKLAKVYALSGAKVEQTLLWQLRQVPENLIGFQMEAAGLRL